MNSITRAVAVAVTIVMMIAATGSAQVASENSVVLAFQRAVDNYVFLHRRLERRVEPMAESRPGDLFTPAVQVALRARIEKALRAHAQTAADLHAGELAKGAGLALRPCILAALPPLPAELEYRMAGRDLILFDTHARLIVDSLPGAVPDQLP